MKCSVQWRVAQPWAELCAHPLACTSKNGKGFGNGPLDSLAKVRYRTSSHFLLIFQSCKKYDDCLNVNWTIQFLMEEPMSLCCKHWPHFTNPKKELALFQKILEATLLLKQNQASYRYWIQREDLNGIWTRPSTIRLTTCWRVWKLSGWVANSVDPHQTPNSEASDLGLVCLLRSFCPILRVYTVNNIHILIFQSLK